MSHPSLEALDGLEFAPLQTLDINAERARMIFCVSFPSSAVGNSFLDASDLHKA